MTFSSYEELTAYISSLNIVNNIDLAVYGDMEWCHNIGHALFDGLYPMYTALVKFGYKDTPFTTLTNINLDDVGHNMAADIVTRFSGHAPLQYAKLDRSIVYHFGTVIAGTNNTGNRVITKEYTLYGEAEFGALTAFKERMYRVYDLPVDAPCGKSPNAIIVHNKRYSSTELGVLKQLCMHSETLRYIDWQEYPSFYEQLKIISTTDIHITGPGTGMMYMPFLKRGAVNINVGYIERTQTNGARPNLFISNTTIPDFILPAFLEQSVCAGARYVNTIYYDRYTYNSIEYEPLSDILNRANQLIGNAVGNNLHVDALIFKEYCKRATHPQEICDHLTNIALMIELFVHEHPDAVLQSFVDIDLLRTIKHEFNYGTKYDIVPLLMKTNMPMCYRK